MQPHPESLDALDFEPDPEIVHGKKPLPQRIGYLVCGYGMLVTSFELATYVPRHWNGTALAPWPVYALGTALTGIHCIAEARRSTLQPVPELLQAPSQDLE